MFAGRSNSLIGGVVAADLRAVDDAATAAVGQAVLALEVAVLVDVAGS
jgi:hypothetical protein